MKKFLLLVLIFLPCFFANAQVKLLSLAQLNKRVANTDTLYVVNFWATWCAPCVAELPNFEKLQMVYKDKPLKVLLISMDFQSKFKLVQQFSVKHKLKAEVYLAQRTSDQELIDGIDKDWGGALPGTLIVNAKKGIRKFYEQEFTYAELHTLYLSSQ